MKKKILSILMLVAILLSVVACTDNSKKTTDDKKDAKVENSKEEVKDEKKADEKAEEKKEEKKEEAKEEKAEEKKEEKAEEKKEDKAEDKKEAAATLEGEYLVTPEYVKENLENDKIIFVDARGEDGAKSGTVPGAIAVAWPALADMEGKEAGDEGWGHILEAKALSEKLSAFGLDMEKEIIIIANGKDGWGDDGRILWELLAAGYKNVKMVNGGIDAIKAAGVELVKEVAKPEEAKVEVEEIDFTHVIDTKELSEKIADYKVVDTRNTDEYEGAVKFGEAKGGRIPGAIHVQFIDLFGEDGMLKSKEDLIAMFTDAGLKPEDNIVTYCTGGIRSAYMQLVMHMCGFENVKNYQGSYYCWAKVNEVEK